MNELSKENTMTVKEVSIILGVTPEAIKRHIRELFPDSIKNGIETHLDQFQITEIKRKMLHTSEVVGTQTDLEMNGISYIVKRFRLAEVK